MEKVTGLIYCTSKRWPTQEHSVGRVGSCKDALASPCSRPQKAARLMGYVKRLLLIGF
jgi:hypothetical protein